MLIFNNKEAIMVKKLIIEKDDETKMLKWDKERIKDFRDKYNTIHVNGVEYIISLDIAAEDSVDSSVMCKFKLVDGKYVFDGVDEL
jgi:hypothetical protein